MTADRNDVVPSPDVITSFDPPAWASALGTSVGDGGQIHYFAGIGTVFPSDGEQPAITVDVRQADQLVAGSTVIAVRRGLPSISVAGVRLTPGEAAQLAEQLIRAVDLLEGTWAPVRPGQEG